MLSFHSIQSSVFAFVGILAPCILNATGTGASDDPVKNGDIASADMDGSDGTSDYYYVIDDYTLDFSEYRGYVGDSNSYIHLTIENGGTLSLESFVIGYGSTSDNTVTITGTDSSLTCTGKIYVGWGGDNNSLTLDDYATISCGAIVIGDSDGSGTSSAYTYTDTLTIKGGASVEVGDGDIAVGNYSGGAILRVEAGSSITCASSGALGYSSYSTGNSMYITGSGASVTFTSSTDGDFTVGNAGGSNYLEISDGGVLSCAYRGALGYASTSSGNSVLITGGGSRWTVASNFYLGASGSNNVLTVADGGMLMVGGTLSITYVSGYVTGNYLQLSNGFLALAGEYSASEIEALLSGKVKVWDGTSYVTLTDTSSLTIVYCDASGDAASALGSYSSYYSSEILASLDGGYTIITDISSVPEPASVALLFAAASLGIVFVRRRR